MVHFVADQEILDRQKEQGSGERVRLLVGVAEMAAQSDKLAEAEQCWQEASRLIAEREYLWWRPQALYWQGMVQRQRGDVAAAASHFQEALAAVADKGCPDYLPLIWLALGELTTNYAEQTHCLEQCLVTANQRARYVDQIFCQQRVGGILLARRQLA